MNRFFFFVALAVVFLLAQHCADASANSKLSSSIPDPAPSYTAIPLPAGFGDYWYAGKAELCVYDVIQERYGETRQAEQVNIFVTEDFSKSKQVKLDDPATAEADRIPVLKLNAIRRFETGIYDYSLMQSVFTPISGMPTLKATASVQDWCGQVFMQTNLAPKGYRAQVFSYFESEGDQDILLPLVQLEDALWTQLRLNPYSIKTGKTSVLPSAIYSRLRHQPITAQEADIQVVKGEKESVLTLQYQSIPRGLSIRFDSNFPFKILGWEETNGDKIASKGVLKTTRRSAYWAEHDNKHAPLRDSLQLRHSD